MKASQILRASRRLLIDKGWIQDAYAKNAAGQRTDPVTGNPASFCSMGSILCTIGKMDFGSYEFATAHRYLVRGGATVPVSHWNDNDERTLEQVLAAFEQGALVAEEEGQ